MPAADEHAGGRPLPPIGREGVGLLGDVPFFSGLSRRTLRRLAKVARQVGYTPGAIIVAAGTPGGAAFFVVVEGEASVRRGSHELARLSRGEFFGELSLLDGRRRAATVVAITDLTAIRLTRDAFRDLVASDVDLAFHVMEVLGQRIRDLEDAIDGLRGAGSQP
jgi:CRP/FNR family transcriptional regulator, cyclic AMP receptor protein